jgi:hypothetical protein
MTLLDHAWVPWLSSAPFAWSTKTLQLAAASSDLR